MILLYVGTVYGLKRHHFYINIANLGYLGILGSKEGTKMWLNILSSIYRLHHLSVKFIFKSDIIIWQLWRLQKLNSYLLCIIYLTVSAHIIYANIIYTYNIFCVMGTVMVYKNQDDTVIICLGTSSSQFGIHKSDFTHVYTSIAAINS